MDRRDLLNNEGYWLTDVQLKLFDLIESYLQANNLTREQFARQLGYTKGYISQVLNGDFNGRLSKLVELAIATGHAPLINFEEIDKILENEKKGVYHFFPNQQTTVQLNIAIKNSPSKVFHHPKEILDEAIKNTDRKYISFKEAFSFAKSELSLS